MAVIVIAALAAVAAIVVGATWAMQDRLVYGPPGQRQNALPGWRATQIPAGSGEITGYQHPGRAGARTLLFLHGGGYGYDKAVIATKSYADAGMNVIIIEYPGRGGNAGQTGLDTMDDGAMAAMAWLKRNDVAGKDLVIYGEGLGATAAIKAASLPHDRLVIVSGVIDVPGMVQAKYPFTPRSLVNGRDPRITLDALSRVKGKVTIVHSEEDEVAPYAEAQRMAKAAKVAIVTIPGGHPIAFNPGFQNALVTQLVKP